jgi:hypothetical protein
MKKTNVILAFLSLGLQGLAQTNNLIVFDQQGEKFWAVLNGIRQNAAPQTNVKITGLNANTYKLKLIFQDSTQPAIDKTVYFQDMGTEETMDVKIKSSGEHVLRYVSSVPLAQAAPPAPDQNTITYTTTAPPMTGSTTVVTQTTTTNPDGASVGMNVNGMNVGMNVTGMGVQTSQTTVTTTTTTSSGGDAGYVQNTPPPPPPPPANTGCQWPMSPEDFESAKNTISSKDFENTKLDIAKQITSSNCLSAEQIKCIMKLFTFENSKLEYAKFAYAHCYDKSNYFKVNDAFEFDSSASDLSTYISNH